MGQHTTQISEYREVSGRWGLRDKEHRLPSQETYWWEEVMARYLRCGSLYFTLWKTGKSAMEERRHRKGEQEWKVSGMVLRGSGHGPDWRYRGWCVGGAWDGARFEQGEAKRSERPQAYWSKEVGSQGSLRKMAFTAPAKSEGSGVGSGGQARVFGTCWCEDEMRSETSCLAELPRGGLRPGLPLPALGLMQVLCAHWRGPGAAGHFLPPRC